MANAKNESPKKAQNNTAKNQGGGNSAKKQNTSPTKEKNTTGAKKQPPKNQASKAAAKPSKPKSTGKREVAQLDKSYAAITGKEIREKSDGKGRVVAIVAGSIAAVVIAAALVLAYLFPWLLQFGTIDVNTCIAGVDVSGMFSQQAIIAVTNAVGKRYEENTMVFTADDQTVQIAPEMSCIELDIPAAVKAACELTEDTAYLDLEPYMTLNSEAIMQALDVILQTNQTNLKQSSFQVIGEFDPATGDCDLKLEITKGQAGINSSIDLLYESLMNGYSQNLFTVDYELKFVEPEPLDMESIEKQYHIDPVNAEMDMEKFTVSDHAYGCTFDISAANTLLEQADYNETVTVDFQVLDPEHTKEEVESTLFQDELGSYTAHTSSKPNSRDINLRLSCEKINGKVLLPGETFDYNKALGKRTAEAGWKQADGYDGGQTVTVYGGGICQASSSLYYCTLIADLEIVTRVNHSYVSSYMPMGMDATVSWGGPDFRFKNNTEYPIRIDAFSEGGDVTVKIMGTDTKDYYVKMEYAIISTAAFETVYEEMTAEEAAAEGKKDGDQLVSPYTGYKVITYKCKYSKETDELISKEEEEVSTYKKRDRVLVKIIEDTPPTDNTVPPTETETPQETEEMTLITENPPQENNQT